MKHILVASVGGVPQVVTETLWAMMHPHKLIGASKRPRKPVVPQEIIMLTTDFKGYGFPSRDTRLEITKKKICDLYSQYKHPIPAINTILVKDQNDNPIMDIRDQNQNILYADSITRVLTGIEKRRKKEKINVHMSIAGGRKSMSSYDHSAMMFFGRLDDELTHVLVDPSGLEGCGDFWWPDQKDMIVKSRDNKSFTTTAQMDALGNDGDSARLDLVQVPFVRLGITIPNVADNYASYKKLVNFLNFERGNEPVIFVKNARTIRACGESITLSPASFTILSMLATARKKRWVSPHDNQCPELRGNVLLQDVRYGRDIDGRPRKNMALEHLKNTYDYLLGLEMRLPKEFYIEETGDTIDKSFIAQTNAMKIIGNHRLVDKTPFDRALGNLNRELKEIGKKFYMPDYLRGIRAKALKGAPSKAIGFDLSPDRIEFSED